MLTETRNKFSQVDALLADIAYFPNVKNDPTVDSGVILNDLINQIGRGRIIVNGDIYIGTQVQVKNGIRLDFINSTVYPMTSIDLFLLYPGGKIKNLVVNAQGKNYTGKVLTLDPVLTANYDSQDLTEYEILGIGDNTGTLVYYHQNNTTANKQVYISFVHAKVQAYGFQNQIELFSEAANSGGTGGWINGNEFHVLLEGGQTQIHAHGAGDLFGNNFVGQLQPDTPNSQRGFYIENGESNKFTGSIWDIGNYSTSCIEWGPNAFWGNIVTSFTGIPSSKVINNTSYYDNTVREVGGGNGEMKVYNSKANKYTSLGTDNTGTGFLTSNGTLIFDVYTTGIDMKGNAIYSLSLEYGTTAQRPTTPKTSQIFRDTSISKVIVWDGAKWVDFMGTAV